jgi:nucleoside-diphosphate-sugar epimerase
VYGIPKKHPIYETDPVQGVGPYGESKILAEKTCFEAIKKGLNVTIIRPKTFVGTHRLGVFEILFDWIHDGKKIPMLGSGNNRYQLLDVDDLVEAIALFLEKQTDKYNGAFNIGAEKFNTVNKDLGELFKYAHSGSKIIATPAFLIKKILWLFEKLKLSPLYQWVYDTADKDSFVSIKKLTKTLDWHPRFSNSEALIKAYQWYLDNYEVIKSRKTGTTHTVGWKQGILGIIKKIM